MPHRGGFRRAALEQSAGLRDTPRERRNTEGLARRDGYARLIPPSNRPPSPRQAARLAALPKSALQVSSSRCHIQANREPVNQSSAASSAPDDWPRPPAKLSMLSVWRATEASPDIGTNRGCWPRCVRTKDRSCWIDALLRSESNPTAI
eukprot:scaffold13094_cov70-Phaeocystis_antarctica.AAC.14